MIGNRTGRRWGLQLAAGEVGRFVERSRRHHQPLEPVQGDPRPFRGQGEGARDQAAAPGGVLASARRGRGAAPDRRQHVRQPVPDYRRGGQAKVPQERTVYRTVTASSAKTAPWAEQ